MLSAMCGVQLKEKNRSEEFTLMLVLSETMHQLAVANCVCGMAML